MLEDVNISDGVRYWSTQIAAAFNDEMLRDGLGISFKSKKPI